MIWKVIPGYSRYEVNECGEIRRIARIGNWLPGPVSVSRSDRGYCFVSVTTDDGEYRKIQVHQLLMLAFVGPPPPSKMVCHWDGDPGNNTRANLRYGTDQENAADRLRHGRMVRGEDHVLAKLTEDQARTIYARCAANEAHADIAGDYGITCASVCNIGRRKTWKCLDLPRLKHVRRLSDGDVLEIAELIRAGTNKSEAGRRFKTSPQAVSYALKYRLPRIMPGARRAA